MSLSKKASKQDSTKKTKTTQIPGTQKKTARSSRVTTRTVNSNNSSKKKSNSRQTAIETRNPNIDQEQTSEKQGSTLRSNLLRIISLLAVIGITIYVYSIREHVKDFEKFGYAGVFLIALMSNATVLLPAPGVAIVYAMGGVFNPLWVGLAAGTGGAFGELSGYLAGFSGQAVIERTDIYNRFKPWVDRYGGWAILVLSAVPNPFFDIAGIAAGIAKMPVRTFLLFTWIGQLIKMSMFAYAGYYSFEWLTNFIR